MNTLRTLWLERHPVFVRRARLVTAKQHAGESATQLIDRIEEMSDDAEIEKMTKEDWVVQFSLTAISDKRIATKWMEASEPSKAKLRELALSVETARTKIGRNAQAEEPGSAKVFATQSGHSSKGAAGSSKSKKETSKAKSSAPPCYNCGSTRHSKKEECPVFNKKVKCDKCGRPGHLQRVCRSKGPPSASKTGATPKHN